MAPALSCEAYLEVALSKPALGSDLSTAAAESSTEERTEEPPSRRSSFNAGITAASASATPSYRGGRSLSPSVRQFFRTPLSSQARPFCPSSAPCLTDTMRQRLQPKPPPQPLQQEPRGQQQASGSAGFADPTAAGAALAPAPSPSAAVWFPATFFLCPAAPVASAVPEAAAATAYNEQVQEDVYLTPAVEKAFGAEDAEADAGGRESNHLYSERLQETLYLGDESGSAPASDGDGADEARKRAAEGELKPYARSPLSDVDVEEPPMPPVKYTFIHYNTSAPTSPTPSSSRRSGSAPALLIEGTFSVTTPWQRMTDAHVRGTCSPCAYFYAKEDGCRLGSHCKFCHICPADEIKNRKKQKQRAIRAQRAALQSITGGEERERGGRTGMPKGC